MSDLLPAGLSIIYARSLNHCIGKDGGLPWSLPEEYAHFRNITKGYPIIMGRRSFEDHDGAIPGSLNIVISRKQNLVVPADIMVTNNLQRGIKIARAVCPGYFVIGGAGLIQEAFADAHTVFESVVNAHIDGDTFLPPLDFSSWSTMEIDHHSADDHHPHEYSIYRHSRP